MTTPSIEIKNIRKSFGSLNVLNGISFSATKGDVIAILGSSGSGKSTLLRCINLLETPDDGEVCTAEEDDKVIRQGASISFSGILSIMALFGLRRKFFS